MNEYGIAQARRQKAMTCRTRRCRICRQWLTGWQHGQLGVSLGVHRSGHGGRYPATMPLPVDPQRDPPAVRAASLSAFTFVSRTAWSCMS